jgi:hydroxysqualene dehydroxylase
MAEQAVVVGGGLAGVAAALRLADRGRQVVLLERRPRLGGAAFSFARGPLTIDNGQHVFLRCCTAYRALLERVGAGDQVALQERLDIPVLAPGGRIARLSRSRGVPAPAHLGAALSRYSKLSPADRARAVRGALALRTLRPSDRNLDAQTLGGFLRRHGQNDATLGRLWGIIAIATLNLDPDEASLALAAKVFRTGLLDRADAADIGYAAVPLGEIHGTAATRALADAGVEVLTSHRVDAISAGATVDASGPGGPRTWHTDTVIVAAPHEDAFDAVPALATGPAAPARELGASPIVNVHVIYDRKVTDLAFAAAVDSPVQWVFDRTEPSGVQREHPGAQYLAITVSAADGTIEVPSKQVITRFGGQLAGLFPAAERAGVIDAFVTRERRATFRQTAGSWARRPGPNSGLDGIWLAGAWTDTGWPDTMESAVRSGTTAAEAALGTAAEAALGTAAEAALGIAAEAAVGVAAQRPTRGGVLRG